MKTLFAFLLFVATVAHAQTSGSFPLTANILMTNSTATLTDVYIQVTPSKVEKAGILFMASLSAANPGTSNVVFTLNLSPDGVNYSTTGPIVLTAACNGTNAVTFWTNLFADSFPNTQYIKLSTVSTTQTNTVTVTALKYYMVSP